MTEPARVAPALQRSVVIVAVDFSAPSRRAIHWAFDYAQRVACDLHVIHAIDRMHLGDVLDPTPDRLRAELQEISKEVEEELRGSAPDDNSRARVGAIHHHVAMGRPADEIIRLADKLHADLIIMGTHGLSGVVERIFIGSVAQKVVREAPCTVVCVKPTG
jgi:nucleotide-binding universal stress UspA family protein